METTVKHLTMEELEAALDHLRETPKDEGVVELIVCRPQVDEREVLEIAELDPVKHFAVLARGVMLKGVGLDVLYPNFLALLVFTILLVGISAWRFRKQLN